MLNTPLEVPHEHGRLKVLKWRETKPLGEAFTLDSIVNSDGRRMRVDPLARRLAIPNHKRAYLERCIALLGDPENAAAALATLRRTTGLDLGSCAPPWRAWYEENRPYLFFSDCDGFRFLVDVQAKAQGIPFEKLREWSSEKIDYRCDEGSAGPRGNHSAGIIPPAAESPSVLRTPIIAAAPGAGD